MASARSKVFESLPAAGLPPQIAGWGDFESFMSTLSDSECISSIRMVWWDIRPHPDFGTIEFRVCDSPHTHTEATALAGPAQTLVVRDDALIDRGELPPPPREWTVRENRWLAARYGIDARLIVEANDDGKPQRRPVRELVGELLAELSLTADLLGTQPELAAIERILDHGSGSMRQRRLVDAGATLADVVHHLADELYDDCFEQA